MEGFLNKQGEKGLVLNLWRKRWFQLDPNNQRIYYYKTKSKEELLGAINLAEASEVVSNEPKDAFSFTIRTRDRAWNLSAASEIDKQAWMAAIQKVIHRAPPTHQVPSSPAVAGNSSSGGHKSAEYLGIFEFEGEEGGLQQSGFNADHEEPSDAKNIASMSDEENDAFDDSKFPPPPNPTPMEDRSFLCGSLPVNVPKMASTWQAQSTWSYADLAGDDSDDRKFVRPDEMAARTYKEMSLLTGLDFDHPKSYSKRLPTYM